MKANDLEQGMTIEQIIRDRVSNAIELANKYHDEAQQWDKPRSRKRAETLRRNAERWEAHAQGLQEALAIVTTAQGWKETP